MTIPQVDYVVLLSQSLGMIGLFKGSTVSAFGQDAFTVEVGHQISVEDISRSAAGRHDGSRPNLSLGKFQKVLSRPLVFSLDAVSGFNGVPLEMGHNGESRMVIGHLGVIQGVDEIQGRAFIGGGGDFSITDVTHALAISLARQAVLPSWKIVLSGSLQAISSSTGDCFNSMRAALVSMVAQLDEIQSEVEGLSPSEYSKNFMLGGCDRADRAHESLAVIGSPGHLTTEDLKLGLARTVDHNLLMGSFRSKAAAAW